MAHKKHTREWWTLPRDKRLGRRVFCSSPIPDYGTLKKITRFDDGREYWQVEMDYGFTLDLLSTAFVLYDYPTEFHPEERVRYRVDGGGYWEGVVLSVTARGEDIMVVIRVEQCQANVVVEPGHIFSPNLHWLTKVE